MADFVGFVGPAYQAPSIYQDAQECINWYPEIDPTKPQDARGVIALYPTPGLTLKLALPNQAEVRCLYAPSVGGALLAVCGSVLYKIDANLTATSVGALSTLAGPVYITDNRIAAYITDGVNRYTYTLGDGTFQAISDGAFTGGGRCDYVDDFIIYNDPNSNQWAATSPLSTDTPALSFSSKDSSPDNIVTLIANNRDILLIGEKTTERWTNAGTFPFPFQRIPGTSFQHGCAARASISRLGETVAWLSKDDRGKTVVIQMAGYSPQRISTHAVESDIGNGVISDAIAFTYQQNGHEFYQLSFPTQDKTWVYDLTSQMWHKRAWRDELNILHRNRANCFVLFQGMYLVGDFENGNIYEYDLQQYTDNGDAILRMRRTPHLTNQLNRVFYSFLQLQFQPGVGLATGQGSDPEVMLRWSDDGGSTWSNYYSIGIGKIGQYKNRAVKRKMGWARDRVYEVTITDPVYAVIISAEIRAGQGVS